MQVTTENSAKTLDLSEDGFGGGGPHEGARMIVPVLDETVDLATQVDHRGKRASADRVLGDQPEPAFGLVEPGAIGGDEMQVKTRLTRQPRAHFGVLVGAVIIDDEVDVERLSEPRRYAIVSSGTLH